MRFLSKHDWRCLAVLTVIIIGAAIGLSGCGSDDEGGTGPTQGFIITEEQAGRWHIEMTFEDDEGEPLEGFDDQNYNETLCPGIDYAQDEYEGCTINILSSTSFRAQCTETVEIPQMDCTISTTLDLTFVFETESFTATGPVTISAVGNDCAEEFTIAGTCNIIGTRTGPVPPGDCGKSAGTALMRLIPACDRIF